MPDPMFDELTRDLPVPALPAEEVRRLGDRRRRRTRAATALAAVAAVAAIAAPVALSGGSGGRALDPVETPTPHEWPTTIPEDFPLADGMALDPSIPARSGHLDPNDPAAREHLDILQAIHVCGDRQATWTLGGSVDAQWAVWSDGKSGGEFRTLAVNRDEASAYDAVARIRKVVDLCGDRGDLRPCSPDAWCIHPVYLAESGDQGLAFLDGPRGEATLYLVIPRGNALLLFQTYVGAAERDDMGEHVFDLMSRAGPALEAMCAYSEVGCDLE